MNCEHSIAYIGGWLPSVTETFVYKELLSVRATGCRVIPCSVYAPISSNISKDLENLAMEARVVYSISSLKGFPTEILLHPFRSLSTLGMAMQDSLEADTGSIIARGKIFIQALASLGLARTLRSRGVVHIHAHMANTPTNIAMYASQQLGIGFSFTGHANDLFVNHSLLKEKLQRACFVACVSDWHRRFYQSIVELDDEKLPIIRCGVNIPPLDRAVPPAEQSEVDSNAPFKVLSVGRLIDKKGMDTLIHAIALIESNHPIRCDIIGDGPLKPILQELIQSLGLQDRVVLRGACPNTEVLDAVKWCDAFVLACQFDAVTNDQDGIPVSLMEAMAQAKCVVTTNLDPITELVVSEQTGFTVPQRDPYALAEALQRLIEDPMQGSRLASSGRVHVEREFSLTENSKKLAQRFRRCIERRTSS